MSETEGQVIMPTENYPVQQFVPRESHVTHDSERDYSSTTSNIPVDEESGKAEMGLVSHPFMNV